MKKLVFYCNDRKDFSIPMLSITGDHFTKKKWMKWRKEFIVGDPVPLSKDQTVESLKAMEIVGLYHKIEED